MEKCAAIRERTTTEPPAGLNQLTPELIKLVEEAQVPFYPGCRYTVHNLINELMDDMQSSESNATGTCLRETVGLFIPSMTKGGKQWQIAEIDKLIYAYTLIRSLKSHGGNAEPSSKAATNGNKVQWNFQPTMISAQQSELVPNAAGGTFFVRESIQDGYPQLQQKSRPTLSLFPQRSEQLRLAGQRERYHWGTALHQNEHAFADA